MATVDGKTSFKIDELVNGSIISAVINGSGQLIFTTRGGATINAGLITKPVGEPWSATTAYTVGDVVGYAGIVWRCKANNTNKPPALFGTSWTRLAGETFDGWSEKDPYFDSDDRTESWEFFWKTGNPVVSLTTTPGEFETGKQALKIAMAATESQRFYQKEENIVRGGEIIVATVRAKLVSAAAGVTLAGNILQNDSAGTPTPFATGLTTTAAAEGTQTLTTSWTTFTFTFTAANAKPRAAINIIASTAASVGTVLVDWVRIKRRAPIPLDSYPVGSVFMSVNNVDPGTIFGGTWTAWGSGRFPVGVDVGQTEFDTVEETGGAKTHVHDLDSPSSAAEVRIAPGDTTFATRVRNVASRTLGIRNVLSASSTATNTTSTVGSALIGDTNASSSLPPYITCYMFKRTA